MNGKHKSLIKDTVIFAIGSLGSKIILFFLVPLYTNYLTTAEYGIAEMVTTFSQLIIPLSAVVINQALIRFGMKSTERPEDVAKVSFVVLAFSIIITILITPIIGLYQPVSEWKWYLAIYVIESNFTEVGKSYLKVKNRNKLFAIISILQTIVLAVMNIIMLTVLNTGVKGYLIANIIAVGFSAIVSFFYAGLHNDLRKGKYDAVLLKQMLQYSFPLIFSNVSWWVIHSSDRIMVEWMIGASVLGIYTVAAKIPSLINVMIGVFNQAWALSSIHEIELTNDRHFYRSVFMLFSTVVFGASILFTSLIKPFMQIYVGKDFVDAWIYTPLLLSAAVFFSISAFIGTLYAALLKTINDMWTTVLCAIINVVVNFFGIKVVGVWGAIIGTVTAYFVIAIIRLFDVKRYMNFEVDKRRYFINAEIMLLQAILVSLDWHIAIVSVAAIGIFVFVNKNEIKQFGHLSRQMLVKHERR